MSGIPDRFKSGLQCFPLTEYQPTNLNNSGSICVVSIPSTYQAVHSPAADLNNQFD